MMEEQWRPVVGYEDLYQVSNYGRVRTVAGHMKSASVQSRTGYVRVTLSRHCHTKTPLVHRIVMAAFVGESPLQVNHIDGVKANNRIDNLEYLTAQQNTAHALAMGLRPAKWKKSPEAIVSGEEHPATTICESHIPTIFELRSRGLSQGEIALVFGCSQVHIGRILRGESRLTTPSEIANISGIRTSRKGVPRPKKGCGMYPTRVRKKAA